MVLDATNAATQDASSAGSISFANPSGLPPSITLNGGTLTGLTGTITLSPGAYNLPNGGTVTLTAPVTVSSSGTVVAAPPVVSTPPVTTPPKAVVPANEIIIGPIQLP